MSQQQFSVMTPCHTPTKEDPDKDTWMKVGTAWEESGKDYVMRISLLTIPVTTDGPVKLFLFPDREGGRRG